MTLSNLSERLRSLVINALPHHPTSEVLKEAQSISEMIDTVDAEIHRIENYLDGFAKHFAPTETPAPVSPPPEPRGQVVKDIQYAFAQGATVAELADRYQTTQALIFRIVGVKPAPVETPNGNGARRGRPRKNQE